MTEQTKAAPVESLSFEEALKQLEAIIAKLESGDVALEQSISLYERGAALKEHCENTLGAARERIEKIVEGRGGEVSAEPASFE
ncbi:exodeoxyribonuclease VII small subunit [Parvularcula sp. ZS-1/3]|uniref:Exodeoxyribonuclease 7 small subunit n=1 Tax=Parvularcula mediterranea TaxID=2732508 RepID=A0A7Y3RLN5_9PROT|nr:exodeoxyribonuclease VII small subunit [Parvularcula mediterranea]NNU16381.1 exodeoxyribonuclease VII small subunit [Parvularcula mediterranea]